MEVITLTLGLYQTNCYILPGENGQAIVIDPGYSPEVILEELKSRHLSCAAILLTHGHFDHVGAVDALMKVFPDCRLWMNEGDYDRLPAWRSIYPLGTDFPWEINFCEDDEHISIPGLTVRVKTTPGHTYGSVCYFIGDCIFTGDTLFAGSCGRIDLPGGDRQLMAWSMEALGELEQDYKLYPGHGESSTLSEEKRANPYLTGRISL